jgi:hypothetical protein
MFFFAYPSILKPFSYLSNQGSELMRDLQRLSHQPSMVIDF